MLHTAREATRRLSFVMRWRPLPGARTKGYFDAKPMAEDVGGSEGRGCFPYCKKGPEARCVCDDLPMSVLGLAGASFSDGLFRHYAWTEVGRKSVLP